MVIQNNIPGLNSKRNYNKNSSKLAKSLEKLSSGYAIKPCGRRRCGACCVRKNALADMRHEAVGKKLSGRHFAYPDL